MIGWWRRWRMARREAKARAFLADPAAVDEAKRAAVAALPEPEHDPATCEICQLARSKQ